MTRPISQIEIEQELLRLSSMLETETDAFAVLVEDEAKKEARYKAEWASTYLARQGAVKERESWADWKMGDAYFELQVAEALVKAKREKLYSLRSSLDALRTLAANIRAQT